EPLAGFIFLSTLFLYGLHRIVGLQKVQAFTDHGRYRVIQHFRGHIWVYSTVGAVGAAVLFFYLQRQTQWTLIVPALLSVAYVLPLFGQERRLRDFHWVKIFLIALVWSAVTVLLPGVEHFYWLSVPLWLLFLERCFFIFAITIPFDIRDLKVDAYTVVKTLPGHLGIRRSKRLAYASLLLMVGMAAVSLWLDFYTWKVFAALSLSALISGVLVAFCDQVEHDYYFTGLMDGMMLLQASLVGLTAFL
ncbi:MAG: UbiA family prenyltransferase, partial [Phaeodactylibacter sp.]|nr:UbiA family prenyltransferase [Phaeodactylibacter sp.]